MVQQRLTDDRTLIWPIQTEIVHQEAKQHPWTFPKEGAQLEVEETKEWGFYLLLLIAGSSSGMREEEDGVFGGRLAVEENEILFYL